jgi:hypothetical protein
MYEQCGGKGFLYGKKLHFARSSCLIFRRNFTSYKHMIEPHKENNYPLSQTGNANETPVYFDMTSSYAIDNTSAQCHHKKSDNGKM